MDKCGPTGRLRPAWQAWGPDATTTATPSRCSAYTVGTSDPPEVYRLARPRDDRTRVIECAVSSESTSTQPSARHVGAPLQPERDIDVRFKSQRREIGSEHVAQRLPVAQPQMPHAASRDRGLAEYMVCAGAVFAVRGDDGRICIGISEAKVTAAKLVDMGLVGPTTDASAHRIAFRPGAGRSCPGLRPAARSAPATCSSHKGRLAR